MGHCLVPGRAVDGNGPGLLIASRMVEKGLVSSFPCTPVVHLGLVELRETSKRNGASVKLPHANCRAG